MKAKINFPQSSQTYVSSVDDLRKYLQAKWTFDLKDRHNFVYVKAAGWVGVEEIIDESQD